MSCMIAGIRLMCKLNFPMGGDGLQPVPQIIDKVDDLQAFKKGCKARRQTCK